MIIDAIVLRKANSTKVLEGFRKLIEDGDIDLIPVSPEIATLAAEKPCGKVRKGSPLHTKDLFYWATAKILDLLIAAQNRRSYYEVFGYSRK